ncbi:MAG TPA: translesion DNA synthesis-associated protein ImuA [Casimicrobiaceae bacterium]|jgi:cell division inhibitor SulA|nr:translesion DNA synthesis-associated protein ImuA [Casimicrobiaceae bacterium]
MKPALAELLHHPLLWRGDQLARADNAVSSGFASLDRELPGGGWPKAALTELWLDGEGIGELSVLLPALKRLTQAGEWIALVAPPHIPYAPAFAGQGVDPARMIVIEAEEDKHRWWAAEQVLRANSAGALLFWPTTLADQRTRRLQLAAQEGEALAFLFTSTTRATQPSPSPLRIRLALMGNRLGVDIFKRRGGTVSAPLLLDVAAGSSANGPKERAPSALSPPAKSGRLQANRTTSFHRQYPVGGPQARIWNRALARADEVRRVPGPDPRGGHALDLS